MKRVICYLTAYSLFTLIANAQPASTPLGVRISDPILDKRKTDWSDKISVTDVNGQPITNRYPDVAGTPYFNENYKYSDILLKTGKMFKNVKARIDLVTQEVHFVSVNGIEAFMLRGTVKEVSYLDTTETGIVSYKFQTGFNSADKSAVDNFYLILSEGRHSFLKSITKKVTEKRNELTHQVDKEFDTYEDYFFYANGEMKRWKKDKDFVFAELADKKAQVEQFAKDNKTSFRNVDDVKKLMNYYNSL